MIPKQIYIKRKKILKKTAEEKQDNMSNKFEKSKEDMYEKSWST